MHHLNTIRSELRGLQRAYRLRRGSLALLAMGVGILSMWVLFVISDLILHLPTIVCWLVWSAAVAGVGAGLYVFGKLACARINDAGMAVVAERALPGIQNRLINLIQLSSQLEHAPEYLEHMLKEEDIPLDSVRPRDLLPRRPFKYLTIGLGVMTLVGITLFMISPAGTARATVRLFAPMIGVAPYTHTAILDVEPKDATVLRGNDIEISVRVTGKRPERPVVLWDRGEKENQQKPLQEHPDSSDRADGIRLNASLNGVFYPSRYRILAGDAKSDWYSIQVISPPGLLRWEADITPPEYVQKEAFKLDKESELLEVPVGAKVIITGYASTPLSRVQVLQGTSLLADTACDESAKFTTSFTIGNGGRLHLKLSSSSELESEETLPFVILLDQTPTVTIVDPGQNIAADLNAQVPVKFKADDDYGITASGVELLSVDGTIKTITSRRHKDVQRHITGGIVIDLADIDARPGQSLKFRIWAEDNAPAQSRNRGRSGILTVRLAQDQETRKENEVLVEQNKNLLFELIRIQRENLRTTRGLADLAGTAQQFDYRQLRTVQAVQVEVRTRATDLLENPDAIGDLRNTLSTMIDKDMADVIALLDQAHRAKGMELGTMLQQSAEIEARILAVLTGMPQWLDEETKHQQKVDLLARLQKLTATQRETLQATRRVQAEKAQATNVKALARTQDRLANDLIRFTDQCWVVMEGQYEAGLQKRVRDVYDLVQDESVYEKMLTASEALEYDDIPVAVQSEQEIVKTLLKAMDIMNRWRVENAREKVDQALDTLKNISGNLEEMEKRQAQIAEVTRELRDRGDFDDDVRDLLGKMDREQDQMADLIEQLAQDLYQFPELPVSNELNSKMFELFEAVEQAADSENAPALEIAVQKEDALLDAIRNTKERVEDIEMWLPDVPDNIAWNMESFDADEFPDMPLVPLPDELEDIVGELMDQAESIDPLAQDSTGNNMMADGEMGWDIMDGPMPNFSAKGKSGNTPPNDNEMTGRSGAGREGQSVGELVEDHVKGLEGRETHARRTADPFQKGSVTEDESSTMKARSTGGGKLGGESESEGMFGKAPRRDLGLPDHAQAASALRRETEALYATARLLYLGTGSLGAAATEMRQLEHENRQMQDFGNIHRKVLRRLHQSQVEIKNDVVLPMPVNSVSKTGGAAVRDVDISKIDEEYRDIVSEYYKSLDSN